RSRARGGSVARGRGFDRAPAAGARYPGGPFRGRGFRLWPRRAQQSPSVVGRAPQKGRRGGRWYPGPTSPPACRQPLTDRPAATADEAEVEAVMGGDLVDEPAIEKGGRVVLGRLDARFLLITRGSRGMALLEREGPVTFMPIHGSDEIADVTGAGDTVISAFT